MGAIHEATISVFDGGNEYTVRVRMDPHMQAALELRPSSACALRTAAWEIILSSVTEAVRRADPGGPAC